MEEKKREKTKACRFDFYSIFFLLNKFNMQRLI